MWSQSPYQHHDNVAAQLASQSEPVAHVSARQSRTVSYKDQVRSVVAVPMATAVPITVSSQQHRPLDPSSLSALSEESRVSPRSDPEGRRAIDPASDHGAATI